MPNSTRKSKPRKPRPDFPLFPHATGRWAKKIRGKFHYFGKVADDPKGEAALRRYLDEKDELLAGRKPGRKAGSCTVRDLINEYLRSKRRLLDSGEITARTFEGNHAVCSEIADGLGLDTLVSDLRPVDFARFRERLAKRLAPGTVAMKIPAIRCVFKFGWDYKLLDSPVDFGPDFRPPSRKRMRKARNEQGKRFYSRAEVEAILAEAEGKPAMKAMVLLGVNCGFGNHDVAALPIDAIDLEHGWVKFPRPKTGVERKAALWPETVAALKEAIAARPEPSKPEHAQLVFLTSAGNPWARSQERKPKKKEGEKATPATVWVDNLGCEFWRLLNRIDKKHKMGIQRIGRSFYGLRHTFATEASGSLDQIAINHVMGHADSSMPGVYRDRIDDSRLLAVANYVRDWLFG